ncbi:MAG: hypothetical protein QM783_04830 [Phycisphaerales bacterium]
MQSVVELYNHEVLEGHREAVAALRELLAQETDPAERRKLANSLLRAKTVKLAAPAAEHPQRQPTNTAGSKKTQALLSAEERRGDRADGSEGNGSRKPKSLLPSSAGSAATDEGSSASHLNPADDIDEVDRQTKAAVDHILQSNDPAAALEKLHTLMTARAVSDTPPLGQPEAA